VARIAQIYGVYRRPPPCLPVSFGRRLMRVRHAGVRTIPHTLYPLTLLAPWVTPASGHPTVALARCLHWAERPTACRLRARSHPSRGTRQPRGFEISSNGTGLRPWSAPARAA